MSTAPLSKCPVDVSHSRQAKDNERKTGNAQPWSKVVEVLSGTISKMDGDCGLSYPGLGFLMGVPEFVFKLVKKTLLQESVSHSPGKSLYRSRKWQSIQIRNMTGLPTKLPEKDKSIKRKQKAPVGISGRRQCDHEAREKHFYIPVAGKAQLPAAGDLCHSQQHDQKKLDNS